ncbi:MAG: acyl-CoA dehydratase activase [Alkaliphilus sp.]
MNCSIGLDIGYATLKCVVLDKENVQIYDSYVFHHGEITEALGKELVLIRQKFGIKECYIGLTGEHGKTIKNNSFNDISALIEGSLFKNKNVQSIIEIGAQSSRYITGISEESNANVKFFMNSSCSAGTGSFLEEQVSRLGICLEDYSMYTERATKIPRIAGRCSVFSKTDMIHHQQDGVNIEDILLGLSYALIRNYKANVVQRAKIEKPIMFVGGVAKNRGVRRAIEDIFSFEKGELIVADNPASIAALGAAILAKKNLKKMKIEDIPLKMAEAVAKSNEAADFYKSLEEFGLGDAKDKHLVKIRQGVFEGFVGIDIGSTSTNLVLIDDESNVVSYRYIRTKGNPRRAVQIGMDSILEEFGDRLKINSIGTTGSGRILIGKERKADIVVNEITAQAKGATHFHENVDTVFEIGGQDSKYIQIEKDNVINFEMNKICAAGTGSFIEEQAKKLSIKIEDYEDIALRGKKPLNLGNRCTVFIEGNISKAIAQGKSKEDITAGLSYSIVNNYLNRVVVNKPIGDKILLQGGIAHNQSVVNAFRAVLKKEIIVPPFFSVLGAFGVALLAKEQKQAVSVERKLRGDSNIRVDKAQQLFESEYVGKTDDEKLTVGIPRVLFMHKLFPLFNAFFKELGFNVVLSETTNKKIIEQSQAYSMDETCYPVKLINGHVADLIEKGIDYLFFPSVHTMKHEMSKTRENYACVYIQTAPQIVAELMDLKGKGIKLLSPALSLKFGKKNMITTMLEIGSQLGKSKIKTALALKKGMLTFKAYEREMMQLGKTALNANDEKVFVVITRAYGAADKGLNMRIPQRLREMGYKVLTLSNLDAHSYDISDDYPNMYWPFGQHILSGAKLVKSTKNLYAIYLTYHGCGPDTILSHYFKEEMKGKPYMHIEVDEHDSNVGVMTRLEAFVESIKSNQEEACIDACITTKIQKNLKGNANEKEEQEEALFIPYRFPYSKLISEMMKRKGRNVEALPPTSAESLEIGKKLSTSKEYLSLLALLGDVIKKSEDMGEKSCAIWIPKTEGSEVYGQYSRLINQKLANREYSNVEIESPFIEDMLEDGRYGYEYALLHIAGDIIMMADKNLREDLLAKVCEDIKNKDLSDEYLISLAKAVYKEMVGKTYNKLLYVLGEANIIFNPMLNDYQIQELEKENKVAYMPLSEMMYFNWRDYLKKEKKNRKVLKRRLKNLKNVMSKVSKQMREHSSFSDDLEELIMSSDRKLPLYSGGNGRYRMAKQFRCSASINGLITMASMYEDTGTIIRLLKTQHEKDYKYPVIDLYFDGSRHASTNERIMNFIYYI